MAAACLALFTISATAQGPGGPPGGPRMDMPAGPQGPPEFGGPLPGHMDGGDLFEKREGFFQKKLGLTDEQTKEMRNQFVNFQERTRKTRMALMTLADEKRTMLMSGKIDAQKLASIDEEIVKTTSELMRERLKMRRDRLSLLTPDQITRLADAMAERHHRRGGHHRGMR